MPTFCRHNRFAQNCPICSRERREQEEASRPPRQRSASRPSSSAARPRSGGLTVRRMARESEDEYRSPLVPGIKASASAQRLAAEIAFACGWLAALAADPPGTYGLAASEPDPEEGLWLAFLTALVSPAEGDDPFGPIISAWQEAPWSSGAVPELAAKDGGPRAAGDPRRGAGTAQAYRAWAGRAGSQQAALTGEAAWTPERRFARIFERLSFPGFDRLARFDLLVALGRTGLIDMRADALHVGGNDRTTTAAKRAFGIGDTNLLERRARELADECEVPIESLELALFNWGGEGPRATLGLGELSGDPAVRERCEAVLRVPREEEGSGD